VEAPAIFSYFRNCEHVKVGGSEVGLGYTALQRGSSVEWIKLSPETLTRVARVGMLTEWSLVKVGCLLYAVG